MKTCKSFFTLSTILLFCNLQAAMNQPNSATPDIEIFDEGVNALSDAYKKNHGIDLTSIEQSYKDKGKLLFVTIQTINKAIQHDNEAMCIHFLKEVLRSNFFNAFDIQCSYFSNICTSVQKMFNSSIKKRFFSFSKLLLRSETVCKFIQENKLFTAEIKDNLIELFLMSAKLENKKSFLKAMLHANKLLPFLNDDVINKVNLAILKSEKAEMLDYIDVINDIPDHSTENAESDIDMNGSGSSNTSGSSSTNTPIIIDVDEDNNDEVTTESSSNNSSEEIDRKSCFEYRDDHHDD